MFCQCFLLYPLESRLATDGKSLTHLKATLLRKLYTVYFSGLMGVSQSPMSM